MNLCLVLHLELSFLGKVSFNKKKKKEFEHPILDRVVLRNQTRLGQRVCHSNLFLLHKYEGTPLTFLPQHNAVWWVIIVCEGSSDFQMDTVTRPQLAPRKIWHACSTAQSQSWHTPSWHNAP